MRRLEWAAAGGVLLAVYAATLAPDVTFWDAAEFLAAVETLGIPHPPGTPLYVMMARVWRLVLGPADAAVAVNLLSAVSTAAAGALSACLVGAATKRPIVGPAAALTAGTMSSVWLNATETEVYAVSLLLSVVMLWSAERAGHSGDARYLLLTAYLFGMAVPLHLTALVAAPAAVLLASTSEREGTRWRWGVLLTAAFALAAGAGTVSAPLLVAGVALSLLATLPWPRARSADAADAKGAPSAPGARAVARGAFPWRRSARAPLALRTMALVALAASPVLFLLVRARLDPAINQANPATWEALADVLARRQYAIPPLWPRQAPAWIQIGNLFEYADWQVALGLSPGVAPSPWRTPVTMLFAALGIGGAAAHREMDRRTWRALLLLLISGSIGVVAYLNLKAGPSYGWGVLPPGTPHEPRERDYFFVLAFWVWGLWAGMGAVSLAARLHPRARWIGLTLAALPIALNWRAVDRGREPEASLPRALAHAILATAPPHAVVFTWGDNDTYPLWYLREAEGVRRDVTLVTIPLLPARWYRAELARRTGLVDADMVEQWRGSARLLQAVASAARESERPLAVPVTVPARERRWLGSDWVLRGVLYTSPGAGYLTVFPAPPEGATPALDTVAIQRTLQLAGPGDRREPRRASTDRTARYVRRLLDCPRHALAAARSEEVTDSLASACNFR